MAATALDMQLATVPGAARNEVARGYGLRRRVVKP